MAGVGRAEACGVRVPQCGLTLALNQGSPWRQHLLSHVMREGAS